MKQPLVKIEGVYKDYQLPKKYLFEKAPVFRALHGINLELQKGTSFGIVGESGCGKSTLARIVMALDEPTFGKVFFDGQDLFNMPKKELRHLRRNFQMVFQDPYGSLNPRKNILGIVAEPLDTLKEKITSQEVDESVYAIIDQLKEDYDLSTITYKLATILLNQTKIKGKDFIGKSMKDIEFLLKRAKEGGGPRGGRGNGGGRNRNRSRSGGNGGGSRDRNRSGGSGDRNRSGGSGDRNRSGGSGDRNRSGGNRDRSGGNRDRNRG
mgnify:CR=1 FL=1